MSSAISTSMMTLGKQRSSSIAVERENGPKVMTFVKMPLCRSTKRLQEITNRQKK
jgi:hypothetical protein